jgi:hypothetical protein
MIKYRFGLINLLQNLNVLLNLNHNVASWLHLLMMPLTVFVVSFEYVAGLLSFFVVFVVECWDG